LIEHFVGLNESYGFFNLVCENLKRYYFDFSVPIQKIIVKVSKLCGNIGQEREKRKKMKIIFRLMYLLLYLLFCAAIIFSIKWFFNYFNKQFHFPFDKELILPALLLFIIFCFHPTMKYPFDLDVD
jgi:hypothetical protein